MTKPTVLIVEDDMLIALETELLLVEAGFVPIGHALDSTEAAALGANSRRMSPLSICGCATGRPEPPSPATSPRSSARS
jgi:hypothetical protein